MNLLLMSQVASSGSAQPGTADTGISTDAAADGSVNNEDALVFSAIVDAQVPAPKNPQAKEAAFFAFGDADVQDVEIVTGEAEALQTAGARGVGSAQSDVVADTPLASLTQPASESRTAGQDDKVPQQDKLRTAQDQRVAIMTNTAKVSPVNKEPALTTRAQTPAQTLVEGRIVARQLPTETEKTVLDFAFPKSAGELKASSPVVTAATSIVQTAPLVLPQAATLVAATATIAVNTQAMVGAKDLAERSPPAAVRQEGILAGGQAMGHAAGHAAQSFVGNTIVPAQGMLVLSSPNVQRFENAARSVDQEVAQVVQTSDRVITNATNAPAAPSTGAETARQVAHQIATAVANGSGKTTEIALNPEELGRVRLSLSAGDGAVTVVILAERPETQDLMRRHIEVLAQEFRDLGYESITFSFNADGQHDAGTTEEENDQSITTLIDQPDDEANQDGPIKTSGLDLRL